MKQLPIERSGIRIFRPGECKKILEVIQKPDMKTQFQALLYSGMRFIEMKRLYKHPSWFDGMFINLPKEAQLKHLRTQLERSVRLNPMGRVIVSYFLDSKRGLPSWQSWTMNLKRWAKRAGLSEQAISCKCTRKTWESWLVLAYPERVVEITLSQGHTLVTSIQHYINLPFTEVDKFEIKDFVQGW